MKRMSDINNNNSRPLGRLTTLTQVEKHEYTYYKHYDTPHPIPLRSHVCQYKRGRQKLFKYVLYCLLNILL